MSVFDNLPAKTREKMLKAARDAMKPGKKVRGASEVAEAVCKAVLKAVMR